MKLVDNITNIALKAEELLKGYFLKLKYFLT